jgi:sulfatase-like protein
MKRIPPLHPWLLALLPVLSMYAASVGQGQGQELLVVAAMALLAVSALFIVAALVFRDLAKAALIVSMFVVLFVFYNAVADRIEFWHIGGWRFGRQRYLLLASYASLALVGIALYRTRRSLDALTGFATVAAAGMLLVPVATIVPSYLVSRVAAASRVVPSDLARSSRTPQPLPDIYYLVFDRYGAGTTIQRAYGYDNQEFDRYLTAKGFFIASSSRSNYLKTALSLASSLNLTLLDADGIRQPRDATDWAPLYEMLANHRLGRFLKAQGYTYVHAGSWWWPTRKNPNASRNINAYPFTPRPLMVLLNSRLVAPITQTIASPWLDDHRQQWSRVNRDLAELAAVPAEPGPKFVFAHVLAPHPPYVFNRDGSFLPADEAGRNDPRQSYVNQLIATNRKIVALIDRILAASATPPIIVLQGDEGPYPDGTTSDAFNWHTATRAQLVEKTGILNAYFLPGGRGRSLHASITPVNSFRVILNEYFGTTLPLLPDRTYAHETNDHPYDFTDVTDMMNGPIDRGAGASQY